MSKTVGTLSYNQVSDRFIITKQGEEVRELHCGDTLTVLVSDNPDNWVSTRIEYSDAWYLVGTNLKGDALIGLIIEYSI